MRFFTWFLLVIVHLIHNQALGAVKKGTWTYGTPIVYEWGDKTNLLIGKYCSIAGAVHVLLGGNHRMDWVTTYPFPAMWGKVAGHIKGHATSNGDVVVGNDVWIGQEVMILSGVSIADGAVIGTRAVVTKDVPPYAVVGGNPAKIIRYRFKEDIIQQLLEIKWWDWSEEKITQAIPFLLSTDIETFIRYAQSAK